MQKKGDKFKFICQYIIEATPDFTYYQIREENNDSGKYLERHTESYLQKVLSITVASYSTPFCK